MTASRPAYVTTVPYVREVILDGVADYAYWQAQLAPEGLTPYRDGDQAVLLLSATRLRWLGLRFNELSISVALCAGDDCAESRAAYLLSAFNSRPLLAWMERTFFRTPYVPADFVFQHEQPASIGVRVGGQPLLHAAMSRRTTPAIPEMQHWEGPVYLPPRDATARRDRFFASLSGETQLFPFLPSDEVHFFPQPTLPGLQQLHDSGFAGRTWRLRSGATHAKSRTERWK
jgi:hypothetical protein